MGIKNHRFMAFCIIIVLLGGGLALTPALVGTRLVVHTHAATGLTNDDLSVVGPPTLSASTVNSIFARLGSPMAGTGTLVEQTSRLTNIDDAFALAVWWTETNDGAAGVGLADRNPGSVRGSIGYPSAYDGYTIYPSFSDAIVYWFHMLKNVYVGERGLSTVYAISYPYVGTSSSPLWAGKVVALMLHYRGEAPPPLPPTPTVAPTPTISPVILAHRRRIVNATGDATDIPTVIQAQPQQIEAGVSAPLQKQSSPSTLSPIVTALIVLFALLLALAIALWARTLSTSARVRTRFITSTTSHNQHQSTFQAPVFRLPVRPQDEPHTDTLLFPQPVALPSTSPLRSFSNTPPSTGKLRRAQLLPSQPDSDLPEEASIPAGGRSTGLLARYGNRHQHEEMTSKYL
ncbi:MAG TPA: hypothetical protein VNE38_10340 [Ktedonobacteraceae bacterium]|nr:hypothetical protein [Ktedonobacteraceae bacterium]